MQVLAISCLLVYSPNGIVAKAGPVQFQCHEPGLLLDLPHAGAQALGLSFATFPGPLARSWIGSGMLTLKLVPVWNVGCHRRRLSLLCHNASPVSVKFPR